LSPDLMGDTINAVRVTMFLLDFLNFLSQFFIV